MSKYSDIKKIPIFTNVNDELFRNTIYPLGQPAILRELDIGPCANLWTDTAYLAEKLGSTEVRVHVCDGKLMDFLQKNFIYRTLPFGELLKRVQKKVQENFFLSDNEKYYLRTLGKDPRKSPADFFHDFPSISQDVKIPHSLLPSGHRYFSSVLRVASPGLTLWTHYDVLDNLLVQIIGSKRAVLFPPSEADKLYLKGDKSEVMDIDDVDVDRFPLFSEAERWEGHLQPGDIFFIPALWFHNMTSVDDTFGNSTPSIAVNVFYKSLPEELYDPRDPYGNKDPLPVMQALTYGDKAAKLLNQLPPSPYRHFYLQKLIAHLQAKCQEAT